MEDILKFSHQYFSVFWIRKISIALRKCVLTIYYWLIMAFIFCISLPILTCAYPFVEQKTFSRIFEIITSYTLYFTFIYPGIWSFRIIDKRGKEREQDPKFESFESFYSEEFFNPFTSSYGGTFKDSDRFIIIANHCSFIDSFLMSFVVPVKKKYMIARIFTQYPILGWLFKSGGHVFVDRNDKTTTCDAVEKALATMQDGCSFSLFPEGIRGKNPYKLEPFKTGAFRLAYHSRLPILPITIHGTSEALPIGGICDIASITYVIDEPFPVTNEDYMNYIIRTRKLIEDNLEELGAFN
jgi:1-acyl-sn-glycerol-3-phosphate acyltransferase